MAERLDFAVLELNKVETAIVESSVEKIAIKILSGGWITDERRSLYSRELELFFTDTAWVCDGGDPQVMYKCSLVLADTENLAMWIDRSIVFSKVSTGSPSFVNLTSLINLSIRLAVKHCGKFSNFI